MARQKRVEYPGAIYHVTSRGALRADIVCDDIDRDTFFARIGKGVNRFGWEVFSAALMTNHFHLFFRTPQPNLSRGMQYLLGGYASWWNHRHRRQGHVFQGRFNAMLVEDESYFWAVSRYVHLNPVPALVDRPQNWPWSSYRGYARREHRVPWIAYDLLLEAWQGEFGGNRATAAYREYVESALQSQLTSPFEGAIDGWILGTTEFASRIKQLISPNSREPNLEAARRTLPLSLSELVTAVCNFFCISESDLSKRCSRHPARPLLAYLARQITPTTLEELVAPLGLSRRDSVPNLVRRVDRAHPKSELRQQLVVLQQSLGV